MSYTPLDKMIGICKFCVGDCLRIDLEEFEGTHRCNRFEPVEDNWYEKYRKSMMEGKR